MGGKSRRQGALIDNQSVASGLTDSMNMSTVGMGLLDVADGFDCGGSGASGALSVMSGINTFATHQANSTSEEGAYAERTMMGGIDTAWGLMGGPAAVVDAGTGGNFSGMLKGGAGALTSLGAMATDGVDNEYSQNFSQAITDGEFGAAAGGVGILGDTGAQLLNMAVSPGEQEFDTTVMERFSENMQNGSELNPMTHLARFGDWSGGALYDLFN